MLASTFLQQHVQFASVHCSRDDRTTLCRPASEGSARAQSRFVQAGLACCSSRHASLQASRREQLPQRRCSRCLHSLHVARCGDDAGGAGVPDVPPGSDSAAQPANPDDRAASDGEIDAAAFHRAAQAMQGRNSDETILQELHVRIRRLQALEDYSEHMQRDEADMDILECSLLIAKHAHPNLDEATCRHEIEKLADEVWAALPENPVPLRIVQALNSTLYTKHGFRGAGPGEYYNVDNSCLNMVLANRVGIPITLGLVWWLIAKRCSLPVIGLNLPGHFMLAPASEDLEVLIDPHNSGEVLFLQDAADKLADVHGIAPGNLVIDPKVIKHKARHAIRPRALLARMLSNLKSIYINRGDRAATLIIMQYLRATSPEDAHYIRDEGLLLGSLERRAEAAACLQQYLALEPRAADAAQIRQLLERMSSKDKEDSSDA